MSGVRGFARAVPSGAHDGPEPIVLRVADAAGDPAHCLDRTVDGLLSRANLVGWPLVPVAVRVSRAVSISGSADMWGWPAMATVFRCSGVGPGRSC